MLARIVSLSIVVAVLVVPPRPIDASELIFNTQDFAPFSYEVNGVVSGPAADVIRRVCTDMKIDCPMRLLPWRRAQQEVVEGKAHAMFVIGWNAERAKWLSFSPPLLNTEYGFFVRDDNPFKFTQNSDVKGEVVGVFGPWNTATSLEKIKAEIGQGVARPRESRLLEPRRRLRPDQEARHHEPSLRRSTADAQVLHRLLAEVHRQEGRRPVQRDALDKVLRDRKSTRLNSSHQ